MHQLIKGKSILLCFLLQLFAGQTFAQPKRDTIPPYKKSLSIPEFSIERVPDSTEFSREQLTAGKRTIFIVFGPDCGHCQHFIRTMLDSMSYFPNTQIVMVSAVDYKHINKFYDQYNIADAPNIIMGRDSNYALGIFFASRQYPTVVLYDENGKFVKHFNGGGAITEVSVF